MFVGVCPGNFIGFSAARVSGEKSEREKAMEINEQALLNKAGLDSSWIVSSVRVAEWEGTDATGKVVPMKSTSVEFKKAADYEQQASVNFLQAA